MMNSSTFYFGLSDEQQMIRESVLNLLERILPGQKILSLVQASEFPSEAYAALAAAGWMGLPYPEQHGGSGASFKDLAVLVESLGYHNGQVASAYLTTAVYGGLQILHGGTKAVRDELIPSIINGKKLLAIAMTEPDAGSDLSAIATRAQEHNGDFLLSGQKTYITCAHIADYIVVAAKTSPKLGYKGITLFLVDARSEGVTIRPLKSLGREMVHTNDIFLHNVVVPRERMLGELNSGWANMMRGLNIERMVLAASAVGNCQKIIDYARTYAKERRAFGQQISRFQAIAHKFADMQIMTETARALTYRVADMLDAGLNPIMETCIAKTAATENNIRCADIGLQIMGGAGYMMDYEMQMFYRDARMGPIGGGTSEIMRNVIAKCMDIS
ncbi:MULTISPECIES: acyl-CoA dehydrogenase family protein [unclassified Variovorax]|uniref:acyl-CoA dehydrogenase family protein n=1 Tax=unclassified Variovorax TaxID=663243 RepID=UPI00076CC793|nr:MULTISPECIES: acyl-CoA dehydrogenase family protein [unclassified Variovorax]KWT82114.1 Butyryl-CoA dehydrogenase [Variovorax sp. WDL1]PNG46037.1 Caffeyl-CoA reductase-Etf complex subunit CarC [Variovorax sp. B2]PNG46321.1 Caffeyl-CoA reductase-Etf complex subunit CarC [Variovorax sp. B4]VTV19139.1 Acyl-CoA dehydrogenase [Variovorax sp. WDL1]